MNVIAIRDLKFSYETNDKTQLVLNISQLDFAQGESVFLFGSSGSGKTTLLEILAGVLKENSGTIQYLKNDFHLLNQFQRDQFRSENIGYIFQQFNLIPYLTVKENIQLPFLFNKKKIDETFYLTLLEELGLKKIENQLAQNLSVGQQQRVAAARAMIIKPQVILADEPTSALDYDHREKFLNLIFDLVRQIQATLIFVSHDRSIMHLFNRQIELSHFNKVSMVQELYL